MTVLDQLIADLEVAHEDADEVVYQRAVQAVASHIAELDQAEQESANALLEAAAGRVAAQQMARNLAVLLPQAKRGPARELPDGLEVVELTLGTGDRVAVVMPCTPGRTVPAPVAAAVAACRHAALSGTCEMCGGSLAMSATGAMEVAHAPACRADPTAVARALRRHRRR